MKTNEERAHSFACLNDKPSSFFSDLEKGYLAGASEQKAIDEEVRLKKCDDMTKAEYDREVAFADWYHKNGKGTPTFSDAIEWARKETIIKVFDRLAASHVISELSVEGFKKAMEELV